MMFHVVPMLLVFIVRERILAGVVCMVSEAAIHDMLSDAVGQAARIIVGVMRLRIFPAGDALQNLRLPVPCDGNGRF